jgi:two-component system, NarL family, nitrate/nitrite response regulator NarL
MNRRFAAVLASSSAQAHARRALLWCGFEPASASRRDNVWIRHASRARQMNIRTVIADSHPVFLDGLETLLLSDGAFSVQQRCDSGVAALRAILESRPDIAVMDPCLPGMGGIDVLRALRESGLETPVVLLAAAVSETQLLEAVSLGVNGIVLKDMPRRMILQCLHKVHAGGRWIENHAVHSALESVIRRQMQQDVPGELTPRELDTVRMVARGLRNKAIARQLAISEGTVKTHVRNVYRKLGLDSRVAVRCYAESRHIV